MAKLELLGWVLFSVLIYSLVDLRPLVAAPGDEIDRVPFVAVAPQDITWEPNTETFFATTFLDGRILQISRNFQSIISELTSPFDESQFLTGIAYDCLHDTFWVVQPQLREIAEIHRPDPESEDPIVQNGGPTGRRLQPAFMPVVNALSEPSPRGLGFDHTGDGGAGSLWVLESVGTVIYEVNLEGEILRFFVHPDDPDGFPGKGASAQSSDVQPLFNEARDTLEGLYVNGFDLEARSESLRRLDVDGNYTGYSIPLKAAGGNIASFIAGPLEWGQPPQVIDPALVVVVESKAETAILDGEEPILPEIYQLQCVESADEVQLSWQNMSNYDRVEVHRDATIVATLASDAAQHLDVVASPGVYEYQIFAHTGDFTTHTGTCLVVIGPGQVLKVLEFLGERPADVTVDIDNRILVTDFTGRSVWIYDSDWTDILKLDGTLGDIEPFTDDDDLFTGIAAHADRRSYFLYNFETNVIAEIDEDGAFIEGTAPFEVRLDGFVNDPEREDAPAVIGMDYCPSGNGGQGSLWLVEVVDDRIYEIDLEGNTIGSFLHPDHDPEVPPLLPNASLAGLALVPGSDCQLLDITGGKLLDFGNTRILRVDSDGVVQHGCFVPLAGADEVCSTRIFGLAHPRDGSPVLRTISISASNGCLMDLDASTYNLKPLSNLSCVQEGLGNTVRLTFLNNDDYDAIEVYRDSTKIADLPADAVEFSDAELPAAAYRYDLRALKGNEATAFLTCTIRVGAGALLDSKLLDIVSPSQLTRDPCDGTYFVTSLRGEDSNKLYHLDENLDVLEVFENILVQFPVPFEIATMAVRGADDCGVHEIYVIGWVTPLTLPVDQSFTLAVVSTTGERLRTINFNPPQPVNGFITHPVGLTWDAETDTFYFYERNSLVVTQFDPSGVFLNQFAHPTPPLRSFVFSRGMTADPQTQGLLSTTAGPMDRSITTVVELAPNGGLTGTTIPLTELPTTNIDAISLLDSGLKVLASRSGIYFVLTVEAYDPIPEPINFKSNKGLGKDARKNIGKNTPKALVNLTWDNAANYDELQLFRDGAFIDTLSGDATSYTDSDVTDGVHTYGLRGQIGSSIGRAAIAEVTTLVAFKRADVNGSGLVDITDPLLSLSFQFLGTFTPLCMDALDSNDSGRIDISDPISSLWYQFLGTFIIPPPGPLICGGDPTPDIGADLGCDVYDGCGP